MTICWVWPERKHPSGIVTRRQQCEAPGLTGFARAHECFQLEINKAFAAVATHSIRDLSGENGVSLLRFPVRGRGLHQLKLSFLNGVHEALLTLLCVGRSLNSLNHNDLATLTKLLRDDHADGNRTFSKTLKYEVRDCG